MPIPRVLEVEQLHFLRDLRGFSPPVFTNEQITDLDRREHGAPLSNKFCEHTVRPAFFNLAESTENGELVICHTHIRLENSTLVG